MDRYFITRVDTESKGYILTRVQGEHERDNPGELLVRVNIDLTSSQEDPTTVVFDKCTTTLKGEAFDDLNVRVRAARMWLIQARGDLRRMEEFLTTI
jgi:hypothetical protein